jgi:hypothetical protein
MLRDWAKRRFVILGGRSATADRRDELRNGSGGTSPSAIRATASRHLLAVRKWGASVLLFAMLAAASSGLVWLANRSSRPSQPLEPAGWPGLDVEERTEVVRLWLPETLIDFARRGSQSSAPQTHSELRAFLERRGQTNLWCAFTTRFHEVNGRSADITFTRRPYRDPQHFQELLDILAALHGQARSSSTKYAGAELLIVPRELATREPRDAIEELTTRSHRQRHR